MNTELLGKKTPLAIALGFFDGVHLGHGALLQHVQKKNMQSAVLTFDQHPSTLLGRNQVPLLSSTEDRTWLMQHYYHIEKVVVSDFSKIYTMPWEKFFYDFLLEQLQIAHVVAGHDFRFGKGGLGNAEKLLEITEKAGISCDIIPPISLKNTLISSTHIRNLLQSGKLEEANQFLGHPHVLSNLVQHGNKIGTNQLGFPTVNLSIPPNVLALPFGVYACRVWVGDTPYHAVTNVGIRPTVEEESPEKITVEGFLLDFPGHDLYEERLPMEFFKFIRNEQKFESFSALSAQIKKDVQSTKDYFENRTNEIHS